MSDIAIVSTGTMCLSGGQGSWSGRNEPLGQFGWISHPMIDFANLTVVGDDNVQTLQASRCRVISISVVHISSSKVCPTCLQCDESRAATCRTEYDHCLLHEGRPHDLDVTCHCSEIYFSQCLFAAGEATFSQLPWNYTC